MVKRLKAAKDLGAGGREGQSREKVVVSAPPPSPPRVTTSFLPLALSSLPPTGKTHSPPFSLLLLHLPSSCLLLTLAVYGDKLDRALGTKECADRACWGGPGEGEWGEGEWVQEL